MLSIIFTGEKKRKKKREQNRVLFDYVTKEEEPSITGGANKVTY